MVRFKCVGCGMDVPCEVVIPCKGTRTVTPTTCLYDFVLVKWRKKRSKIRPYNKARYERSSNFLANNKTKCSIKIGSKE